MEESSRPVVEGDLYTVEQRLDTFQSSHWPYESGTCVPLKMAEAGFYFCGSLTSPDWVRCFVCHHELDGWEDGDIPWKEHEHHNPDCPYISTVKDSYALTVGEILELEKSAAKLYIKKETAKLRSDAEYYYEQVLQALHNALDQLPED